MRYDFMKQVRSFGYAWKGIRQCIGKEQNLSFHLIATIVVVAVAAAIVGGIIFLPYLV